MESVRSSESSEERRSDSSCERVSSDLRVSRVRERSSFWAVRDWMVCSLRSSSSYMMPPVYHTASNHTIRRHGTKGMNEFRNSIHESRMTK